MKIKIEVLRKEIRKKDDNENNIKFDDGQCVTFKLLATDVKRENKWQ